MAGRADLQLDAGEPEAGRIHLGGSREVEIVLADAERRSHAQELDAVRHARSLRRLVALERPRDLGDRRVELPRDADPAQDPTVVEDLPTFTGGETPPAPNPWAASFDPIVTSGDGFELD